MHTQKIYEGGCLRYCMRGGLLAPNHIALSVCIRDTCKRPEIEVLEIIGESWLGLLGADSLGISSDFTRPLPAAISPRLPIGFRKTGYLDLSPGPGDCKHNIFRFTRSPPGGGIYRTNAGRCRTAYRTEIKSDFFSRKLMKKNCS